MRRGQWKSSELPRGSRRPSTTSEEDSGALCQCGARQCRAREGEQRQRQSDTHPGTGKGVAPRGSSYCKLNDQRGSEGRRPAFCAMGRLNRARSPSVHSQWSARGEEVWGCSAQRVYCRSHAGLCLPEAWSAATSQHPLGAQRGSSDLPQKGPAERRQGQSPVQTAFPHNA